MKNAVKVLVVSLVIVLILGFALQAQAGDSPGTQMWRWDIVNTAYSWLGTPYREGAGGNSTLRGADCSGFVWLVYNQASSPWATYNYRTVANNNLGSRCYWTNNPQPGDLVLLYNHNSALGPVGWNHVGIYLGNGYFIHDNAQAGYTIVDNLYNANPVYRNSRFWTNNFYIYFGFYYPPDRWYH